MPRSPNRIGPFLSKVNLESFLNCFYSDLPIEERKIILTYWDQDKEKIRESWIKRFPDLRFGQLLINLGLIPGHPQVWHLEDDSPVWVNQAKDEINKEGFYSAIIYSMIVKRMRNEKFTPDEMCRMLVGLGTWMNLHNQKF